MPSSLPLVALLACAAPLAARAQATPEAQVRPLAAFHAIRIGGGIALTIRAGHEQRVEVSAATEEFREHLVTKVDDGTLQISYDDLLERDDRQLMKADHKLRVTIAADYVTMLTAGSGAAVQTQGNFAAPDCVLDVSSGAVVTATGLAPQVLVVRESSGAAVTLAGTAPRLDVRLIGGATFDGQKLQSTVCQLEAIGGSVAHVYASQELLLEATSGSVVRYYGPATVTKTLSGGSTASAR